MEFGGTMKLDIAGSEIELGILYLASYLEKHGVEVTFLDMSIYPNPEQRLIKILRNKKFDYIGLSAYTAFIAYSNLLAAIIKNFSDAKIVIGGAHASALPVETMKDFKNFDYLVYGEGEETFLDIVNGQELGKIKGLVWKKNGEIIKNPPREEIKNLDDLPFPARHLLDMKRYLPHPGNYKTLPSTALLSSRGCPYQCTFCSRTGSRLANKVRFRSVPNIIKEIKHCINKYGIHDFRFYDDTFVIPKKRLMHFCKELLRQKIDISWNCYSRVDTIDFEMLKMMKKAGCYHIKYGVEFGTAEWLKRTKKNATLEQAKKAIDLTKKAGIAAKASFMIGMPGETVGEIKKTIKFAKELNPTYSTFSIFTPLPGSHLFDVAQKEKKLLTTDFDNYYNCSKPILKDQLDLKLLNNLLKKAYFEVYFNPRFVMHRISHLLKNPSIYEVKTLFRGAAVLLRE